MDFFKNHYYKINRMNFVITGLWPYHHWRTRIIKELFFLFILGLASCTMVFKLIVTAWSIDFVTYALQFMVPGTVHTINMVYFAMNIPKLKMMLDHIKGDWDIFQPDDTKIISKYAERGRLYTLILTVLGSTIPPVQLIGFQSLHDSSVSNATGQLELPLPVDYLVDHRKYIYLIFIHMLLSVDMGMIVTATVGTFYISSVQHACGMFTIVGHRLETMFDNLEEDDFVYNEYRIVFEKIFYSILFHTRAIKFCDILNTLFGPVYLSELLLLTALLSSDIFRLFHTLQHGGDVLLCVLHIIGCIVCVWLFSYTGQELLDHSTAIFEKAYNSRWYLAPVGMQMSLKLIMLRSLKESAVRITKTITVSYEMLGSILQVAVSYFMAMYSLQQNE